MTLASSDLRRAAHHLRGRTAVAGALALALSACGGSSAEPVAAETSTLTVFAAASLTKAFGALEAPFEKAHPGVDVVFSFAGSQALVAQVQQGSPADVLATADRATAETVADQLQSTPTVFAHNSLAIVTPPGNPAKVTTLADLARPGLKVVLAGPTVPVGKAAQKALDKAGVTVTPVSLEDAVTGVVSKVRLGEADAGIAYATDLVAATDVEGTPLAGTTTDLVIAPLKDASDDAATFVSFVEGTEGQQVLRTYGFT